MLDKFLEVAYRSNIEKTASRKLVDRLKEFPLEELKKLASGDGTCKLAYAMDCTKEGGDDTWLGKYTGTPLFAKAVELEKGLLQLDMEDQQAREQERAMRPQPSDTYAKRDAIQLQKRMLDLDLVMAENGVAPAEEPVEAELEAAGAPPPPAKEEKPTAGPTQGPPGAAAQPSAEDEEAAALELAAEEAAAGGPPPQEGPLQQAAPPKPKPKAPPKEEEAEEGGPKIEVKQSAAKVAAIIDAGRFLAKTAGPDAKLKLEIAKKHPALAKEAAGMPAGFLSGSSYLPEIAGAAAGANKGSESGKPGSGAVRGALGAGIGSHLGEAIGSGLTGGHPAGNLAGAALGGIAGYKALTSKYNNKGGGDSSSIALKSRPHGFVGRAGEQDDEFEYGGMSHDELRQHAADFDAAGADVDANPGKYRMRRALGGGLVGASAGALAGRIGGRTGLGALLGGLGGAAASALPKPHGGALRDEAAAARAYSKNKALDEKTAGFIGSALNAGKAALPAIGGALNAGKSLATSAYQSGGLKQVAGSFGNVAKNFAMKNPLAAAGVVGAGGLVAGKALSSSQPRA